MTVCPAGTVTERLRPPLAAVKPSPENRGYSVVRLFLTARVPVSSLPLVLAGPIVRRVTTSDVAVWIAMREPREVALSLYAINGARIVRGRRSYSIALGPRLHLALAVVRGVALLMAENTTVIGLPPGIRAYGNEALIYLIRGEGGGLFWLAPPEVSGELLRRMDRILPYPVIITAVVVALAMFLLRKTQFGRHVYAIGGNMEAARRAGIPVDRRIIGIYVLSAVTAGIAGFLSTLRFSAGSAVIGDPLLLSSIAAVIIGGVSLFGGAGSITGTVIGSLIIAVLTTGLVMLNVDAFWQFIVVGAVVIVAVLIDQSRDLIVGRARQGPPA